MAFSATITSFFINRGLGVQYWIAMIVLIIIGILSLIPLLKVKDANAATGHKPDFSSRRSPSYPLYSDIFAETAIPLS